jgi:hypothetical protein
MRTGYEHPRSIAREIEALDQKIAAIKDDTLGAGTRSEVAANHSSLSHLEELRANWVREQKRLERERIRHSWHMFSAHLELATEHFDQWRHLATKGRL